MATSADFCQEYNDNQLNIVLPPMLAQRYTVLACLKMTEGRQVYLIKGYEDGKKYILKCSHNTSHEMLEQEYELHRTLQHSGLLPAVEFERTESGSYFVRDYAEGITITDLVEMSIDGYLQDFELVEIALQICDILSYLHGFNPPIIHRDIKPDNIIVIKGKQCLLIDFGIARRFSSELEKDTFIMGTEFTSPPEQYGYQQTDARSDIYSLGVLMFYMATGSIDIRDIDKYPINEHIKRCINKCIRFSPEDRYTSVLQLKRKLQKYKARTKRLGKKVSVAIFIGVIGILSVSLFAMRILPIPGSKQPNDKTAALHNSYLEGEAENIASAEAETVAGSSVGADADDDAESYSRVEAGKEVGAITGADTGADAGSEVGTDVGTVAGADTGAVAVAEVGAVAGVDTGTDAEAEVGADTGANAGEDAEAAIGAGTRDEAGADAMGNDRAGNQSEAENKENILANAKRESGTSDHINSTSPEKTVETDQKNNLQENTASKADENEITSSEEESPYIFKSALLEKAVRLKLGKKDTDILTKTDLNKVEELFICGEQVYSYWNEHFNYGKSQYMNNGSMAQAGLYAIKGGITTLEDCANMQNLHTLALYNQSISDLSPLRDLTNLRRLGLGTNDIRDTEALSGLPGLTALDLSGNPIGNSDLYDIGLIKTLEDLDLSETAITSISPISHLKLKALSIWATFLMDCEGIDNMTSLEKLVTTGIGNTVTEKGLGAILKLSKLQELRFMGSQAFDLSLLARLPKLTYLDLCGYQAEYIDGLEGLNLSTLLIDVSKVKDLSPISKMTGLSWFGMRGIPCTDYSPIARLKGLKMLTCNEEQAKLVERQINDISFRIIVQ